jgi:pSer/pThr/pTyr-binding forkhead associated (FHA) protein
LCNIVELYLAKLGTNSDIKIGRASDCDIKISDISVSRSHARLYLDESDFYIKDLKSKFGTL